MPRQLPNEIRQLAHGFRKIQEAAYDGQNGSAEYALDRLALIQALATTILLSLEKGPASCGGKENVDHLRMS